LKLWAKGIRNSIFGFSGWWLLAVFTAVSLSFPLMISLQGGAESSGVTVAESGLEGESSAFFDSNASVFYIQTLSFDPEAKRAKVAFYPWPTEDLGVQYSSSVVGNESFRVFVDGQNAGTRLFGPGEAIGSIESNLDVVSRNDPELANDGLYPFDSYEMEGYASVEIRRSGDATWTPIQSFDYFYNTPLPGFTITYTRLSAFNNPVGTSGYALSPELIEIERSNGQISFLAKLERSFTVQATAIFIYAFSVISAIVLALVSWRLLTLKKRPPLSVLIWAAAAVLGLLQLRSMAPGNPRIGIAADIFFFFPSLFLILASMVAAASLWIYWSGARSKTN
jgi:hypothetical protein